MQKTVKIHDNDSGIMDRENNCCVPMLNDDGTTTVRIMNKDFDVVNVPHESEKIDRHPYYVFSEIDSLVNFGTALNALLTGSHITRKSWEGGKFLLLELGKHIKREDAYTRKLLAVMDKNNKNYIQDIGCVKMVVPNENFAFAWVPNQSDMLSYDWEILD